MTQTDATSQHAAAAGTPEAGLLELERFEGSPAEFIHRMLMVQVRLCGASAGAVLRPATGQADLLSVFPEDQAQAGWMTTAAQVAIEATNTDAVRERSLLSPTDLYGQPPRRVLMAVRLRIAQADPMVTVLLLEGQSVADLDRTRRIFQLAAGLAGSYELRQQVRQRQGDLERLRAGLETLAALNERNLFGAASISLCNELADRWRAERVSLGLLRRQRIHLLAMSHCETITRKMQAVRDLESAMDECFDQDLEVLHPVPPETPVISRAAKALATRAAEPTTVLSLPLRRDGEPVGVITLERPATEPFQEAEVAVLRVTCDLVTPRLTEMDDRDRWFGARAAKASRRMLAGLLGPRHTWAKVAVLAGVVLVLAMTLIRLPYRVQADATLEPAELRQIVSPFDGVLAKTLVEPGDSVVAGQVLARLKIDQLRLQQIKAQEEWNSYRAQEDAALTEGKVDLVHQAQAQQRAAQAQIDLLQTWIDQASITSPIDGYVLQGDWSQVWQLPLQRGQALFEVAPKALRAELQVPEDRIADIRLDATGELATVQQPDRRIPFVVEWISPLAEPAEGGNVFRVRVRLTESVEGLRPGLEGVAKIDVETRSLGWLATHRLVDWIRMKLWL